LQSEKHQFINNLNCQNKKIEKRLAKSN